MGEEWRVTANENGFWGDDKSVLKLTIIVREMQIKHSEVSAHTC